DLHQYIGTVWNDLQKPIKISDDYPLWARITPVELSTVPLSGLTTGIINQSIGVKAVTELFYGKEPGYKPNPNLPEIKILSRLDNNFTINLPIDISFEHINQLAKQQMLGYKLTQGKYTITVNDINIYGNDLNLVVAVKVSGSVNGTIYLAGKPWYDKSTSTVRIIDLDYEFKTKNVLVKSAGWIFKHGLKETLQQKLVYPLGDQLKQTRTEISDFMKENKKFNMFTVSGSIQNLDIDRIMITRESLRVLCLIEGKLNLKLSVE
ncbi:MAG: DUF4403 family protein, partial [Bacteroidota bacterium]